MASPVFGFAIDKTGRNVFWIFAGCVLTLACHAALAFTFINPFVAMVSEECEAVCIFFTLNVAIGFIFRL